MMGSRSVVRVDTGWRLRSSRPFCLLLFCYAQSSAARTPNILFIMADQHRNDAVGGEAPTPHLNALASEGVRFLTHYSSTPTCTPARAAILTGRSPWRHGMLGYGDVAPRYAVELPTALAEAGYRTAVIGKDHFGWDHSSDSGVAHGFQNLSIYDGLGSGFVGGAEYDNYDRWFQQQRPGDNPLKSGGLGWNSWRGTPYEYDEFLHPTAWTGRLAVEQIWTLTSEEDPFFLKVSFHRPHSPYDPPQRCLDAIQEPSRPPAAAKDSWDKRFKHCKERGTTHQWCGEVKQEDLSMTRRAYYASVGFVDEQIGLVLQALRATGVLEQTFILYTSDHGDQQMDHYLWRKGFPFEGSTRVPLILRWPAAMDARFTFPRNSTMQAVTELRDILPTFLDAIGRWDQNVEKQIDGRPLTWLLQDRASEWRRWIDLEHSTFYISSWNALTDGETKYIFHAHSGYEQLFNLTSDPEENLDLARHQAGPHGHGALVDGSTTALLHLWRQRLVQQFERENRGPGWVSDGQLVKRLIPCLYSPHYPQASAQKLLCQATSSSPHVFVVVIVTCALALVAVAALFACGCRRYMRKKRAARAATHVSPLGETMLTEADARAGTAG